jgi:hypothetical protein
VIKKIIVTSLLLLSVFVSLLYLIGRFVVNPNNQATQKYTYNSKQQQIFVELDQASRSEAVISQHKNCLTTNCLEETRLGHSYLTDKIQLNRYFAEESGLRENIRRNAEVDVVEDLNYLNDTKLHASIWKIIYDFTPEKLHSNINQVIFESDGLDGVTLASQFSVAYPCDKVNLYVDPIDIINNYKNRKDVLISTLIHESSHWLARNKDQSTNLLCQSDQNEEFIKTRDESLLNCNTYLTDDYTCLEETSYLFQFYELFWVERDPTPVENWEERETIFAENPNSFVSVYATTELEEDFAESFKSYILDSPAQSNTLAEEKILFFDQFDEIKEIKNHFQEKMSVFKNG